MPDHEISFTYKKITDSFTYHFGIVVTHCTLGLLSLLFESRNEANAGAGTLSTPAEDWLQDALALGNIRWFPKIAHLLPVKRVSARSNFYAMNLSVFTPNELVFILSELTWPKWPVTFQNILGEK